MQKKKKKKIPVKMNANGAKSNLILVKYCKNIKKKKIAQHLLIFVLVLLNLIIDLIMIKRSRISANEMSSERYREKL